MQPRLTWLFFMAAELIAATRGRGYLLSDGRETGRPDLVFGAILLLALPGKLSDCMLKAIELRTLSWRDTHEGSEAARCVVERTARCSTGDVAGSFYFTNATLDGSVTSADCPVSASLPDAASMLNTLTLPLR